MTIPSENRGLTLINELISSYYKGAKDIAPDRITEREFGVGNFDVKISQRHMSFRNEDELKRYLSLNSVPYVSASSAYYRFPSGRPMEKKGWKGSELVFDLDVTDMDLSCQLKHGKSWICRDCLDAVRNETIKLIYGFLMPDFGFSDNMIEVNFSGNRGYHVHVKEKDILELGPDARREISNYISGSGVDFVEMFPTAGRKGERLVGPKPSDRGWRGKIARNFLERLDSGIDSLAETGMDRQIAGRLYRKRSLVQLGINNGNWDMVYVKNKSDFWKGIIERQAVTQSDKIDRNVTNDPTHLLRLPNSIHGSTGLIAKKLKSPKELYSFEPMKRAIAFREGFMKIRAHTDHELLMNGQKFGPYAGEIKVPTYVGVYLFLKGLAEIISFN